MWSKRNNILIIALISVLLLLIERMFIKNNPLFFLVLLVLMISVLFLLVVKDEAPKAYDDFTQLNTERIIQAIDLPICIIDTEAKILFENTMFKKLFQSKEGIDAEVKNYFTTIVSNYSKAARFLYIEFRTYRVVASQLESKDLVVTFTDITEYMESQNMQKRFIADASHELKTPLTSIKLTVDILKNSSDINQQDRNEFLDNLERQTNRLMLLVNDLLTMSRLASARIPMRYETLSLNELLAELVFNQQTTIDKKGIDIILPTEDINLYSDRQKLSQILENLFVNALNYTNFGNIRFLTEVASDNVKIRVADTGTGISAKDINFVFDRFFRSDSARSRDIGGTGLGLSIVKELVENLGGSIRVKSELNAGTVFTIELPQEELTEN